MTIEHWTAHRVTAGDMIERWSVDYEGRTLLTFETEFEARAACRKHGWIPVETVELGVISPAPSSAPTGGGGEGTVEQDW